MHNVVEHQPEIQALREALSEQSGMSTPIRAGVGDYCRSVWHPGRVMPSSPWTRLR
jgi:hypothetical protein